MSRIRRWLRGECVRTTVRIEEKTEEQRKAEAARAADTRHGVLGMAGRGEREVA